MAENKENIILEVARKQFVKKGFAATRMQEIADEAGINKAMLHYYFRSKEKLYHAIIVSMLHMIIPRIEKAMSHPGSFMEKVEKLVNGYISTFIEHPEIPGFILSELSQKRETFITELKNQSTIFPAVQTFMLQFAKEKEAGRIRAIHPLHLTLSIVSMTVFPFVAKPVFCTLFDFPEEEFENMMLERKAFIVDFVKHSLKVD